MSDLKRVQKEILLDDDKTKYQVLAENTYDWEFWLDPEGVYLYVSPATKRITGYAPEDFTQDPTLSTRLIHSDDYRIMVILIVLALILFAIQNRRKGCTLK